MTVPNRPHTKEILYFTFRAGRQPRELFGLIGLVSVVSEIQPWRHWGSAPEHLVNGVYFVSGLTNFRTLRKIQEFDSTFAARQTCRASDCGSSTVANPHLRHKAAWTRVIKITIVRRNSSGYVPYRNDRTERPECQKHVVTKKGVRGAKKVVAKNVMTRSVPVAKKRGRDRRK